MTLELNKWYSIKELAYVGYKAVFYFPEVGDYPEEFETRLSNGDRESTHFMLIDAPNKSET